jgi:hypothetical protein
MSFTKEEFEAWHRAKQKREWRDPPTYKPEPVAVCIHCHQPFGLTEGMIYEDFAICDVCDDD